MLFKNQKRISLTLPSSVSTLKDLIALLKKEHLTEKPDLFVQGETVRPGILVLINDVDWELEGELAYEIQPEDRIVFISTLHGG